MPRVVPHDAKSLGLFAKAGLSEHGMPPRPGPDGGAEELEWSRARWGATLEQRVLQKGAAERSTVNGAQAVFPNGLLMSG